MSFDPEVSEWGNPTYTYVIVKLTFYKANVGN